MKTMLTLFATMVALTMFGPTEAQAQHCGHHKQRVFSHYDCHGHAVYTYRYVRQVRHVRYATPRYTYYRNYAPRRHYHGRYIPRHHSPGYRSYRSYRCR